MAKQIAVAAFRVRIEHDTDAVFEECNGESRPLTEDEYAENAYMRDGREIPYAEYLDYYGNPDRHVYGGVVVDTQCPHCGEWKRYAASLWHIDFMDDDREAAFIGNGREYTPEQAIALPGYLGECAREVLIEAGWKF